MQNIVDLKMNELLNKKLGVFLKISPFRNSGEEGFTDLFFMSLGSPDNISTEPLGS
jgi:hypothetical protein